MGWIGTICNILGAFLVSVRVFIPGYILFILGCVVWVMVSVRTKDRPLLTQTGFFMVANLIGLFNAIR